MQRGHNNSIIRYNFALKQFSRADYIFCFPELVSKTHICFLVYGMAYAAMQFGKLIN